MQTKNTKRLGITITILAVIFDIINISLICLGIIVIIAAPKISYIELVSFVRIAGVGLIVCGVTGFLLTKLIEAIANSYVDMCEDVHALKVRLSKKIEDE